MLLGLKLSATDYLIDLWMAGQVCDHRFVSLDAECLQQTADIVAA